MSKITLKALRVNSGFTQQEAAEKLGVSINTIRNWEYGKYYPSVIEAQRICALYEVPFDCISFAQKVN